MSRNRLIGATFLVAGTTIGAGMLALPITAYGLGFIGGVVLLAAMWLFMYYAATVTAGLNVQQGKGLTIASLARKTFGPKGEVVASFSLLFLFYALLTAYTVGGASVLRSILRSSFAIDVSPQICMLVFTLVFGGVVTTTMTGMDYLNRLLFILKVGAFGGMAIWLLPKVSPDLLATSSTQSTFQAWHLAIPIVFTSFGFHGSIPSVMNYLQMNRRQLKIAFLVGSLIPLLVYILWLAITIGTISPDAFTAIIAKGGDLGNLVTALNDASGSKGISIFTDLFAGIGVITSYLGVGIGVVDFYKECLNKPTISLPMQDIFKCSLVGLPMVFLFYYAGYAGLIIFYFIGKKVSMIKFSNENHVKLSAALVLLCYVLAAIGVVAYYVTGIKFSMDEQSLYGLCIGLFLLTFCYYTMKINSITYLSGLMTFIAPLFIALIYPQGFIAALGYAAIALSMLAVILPALIAIKIKKGESLSIPINLYLLLVAGISIIVLEVLHIIKAL